MYGYFCCFENIWTYWQKQFQIYISFLNSLPSWMPWWDIQYSDSAISQQMKEIKHKQKHCTIQRLNTGDFWLSHSVFFFINSQCHPANSRYKLNLNDLCCPTDLEDLLEFPCLGYQAGESHGAGWCGMLCDQWWWILYRAWLPLRGVNEEDSQHQSHSSVFLEILHNPIWS